MSDPESKLSRKRSQKEFEELLLKDVLIELEAGDGDYWEQKAMELVGEPGYTPTAQQRAAFEERLDLEVKRIQKPEKHLSHIDDMDDISNIDDAANTYNTDQTAHIAQITKDRRQKRQRILRKIGSIAAVLVLFIFMTMYHTVDAFAAGVDRFIATMVPDEGAEELRIEEKNGAGVELNMADYVGMYMPDWVPRGYMLMYAESHRHFVKMVYTNEKGDVISYEVSENKSSLLTLRCKLNSIDSVNFELNIISVWPNARLSSSELFITPVF